MHIFWKYITDSSFKMLCVDILSSILYVLCIETKRNFVNQNKENITHIISQEAGKISYEFTFRFISIENGCKQKSKNTLRIEINPFYDG